MTAVSLRSLEMTEARDYTGREGVAGVVFLYGLEAVAVASEGAVPAFFEEEPCDRAGSVDDVFACLFSVRAMGVVRVVYIALLRKNLAYLPEYGQAANA